MARHYSGPAEALLAVVKDDVLAGRRARERRVEAHLESVVRQRHAARGIGLPVAQLHRAAEIRGRRRARDPVRRDGGDARGVQRRVVRPLDRDQRVAGDVLGGHEPGSFLPALAAADAEAAALPERVALEAAVAADDFAIRRLDGAGPARQPAPHERPERALADEADPGGVALVRDGQAALACDAPHLGLAQAADRKVGSGKLARIERMEEVALVLAAVDAAQQPPAVGARVVAGREAFGAEAPRVVERDAELDFTIAKHVRVRRAARPELREEMREHALAVLGREARPVQRDAELLAHAARVLEVGGSRAVAVVVLGPVGHEQRLDAVAGVLQERGGHRRIDPPGERDDDAGHRLNPPRRAGRARRAGPA